MWPNKHEDFLAAVSLGFAGSYQGHLGGGAGIGVGLRRSHPVLLRASPHLAVLRDPAEMGHTRQFLTYCITSGAQSRAMHRRRPAKVTQVRVSSRAGLAETQEGKRKLKVGLEKRQGAGVGLNSASGARVTAQRGWHWPCRQQTRFNPQYPTGFLENLHPPRMIPECKARSQS